MLIQVGSEDGLLADAVRWVDDARAVEMEVR